MVRAFSFYRKINMKPKPFERLKTGDVFRDLDGNILMKLITANDGTKSYNCVVLIGNQASIKRGNLDEQHRDSYCEFLEEVEIAELRIMQDD